MPGRATLLLRDRTQRRVALVALDPLLPAELRLGVVSPDSVIARSVRWDAAELYDWLAFLESNFTAAQGTVINGWGIDPFRNHVTITIEDPATLPAAVHWLQGLRVPCRLVVVEAIGQRRLWN